MNSEKDIELHDADDTGICLTFIEKEADDPTTDVDFTGTSVNHIETDDDAGYTMRGRNHIDAQCEGIDMDDMYDDYIFGRRELADINREFSQQHAGAVKAEDREKPSGCVMH